MIKTAGIVVVTVLLSACGQNSSLTSTATDTSVDHRALPGSPRETGNTLYCIDPDIVIEEIEAAGFVLEASSDILRNPDDDHSLNMADPQVRGKSDRFVLRFRKPG